MLKSLKQIGLKEKEIKVYLTILKLGSLSTQTISSETGIKRTTVYLVLEKLKKMERTGREKIARVSASFLLKKI